MKTQYLPLILILSFLSSASFGQFEKFDLEKYKNPFYKRQQLDLSFYLSGSSSSDKSTSMANALPSTRSSFNGSLAMDYRSILNSSRKQSSWLVSLRDNPTVFYQKYEYYFDSAYVKSKSRGNDLSLNFMNSNRFYSDNLKFFEIDVNGGGSRGTDNSNTDYYGKVTNTIFDGNSNKYTNNALAGEISFRLGKGRIEYVEDARLAVYILDDLNKHSRLSRTPTDDEIMEFAKVITQITNKRFFDSRIRRIEEITKADSFLIANNLIVKNDASYFTTLNDNWINAAGPERASGFRYSFGVSPFGKWSLNKRNSNNNSLQTTDSKDGFTKVGLSADLLFDYNKPLSLKWQFDGTLDLKYSFYGLKSKTDDYLYDAASMSLNDHMNEFYGRLSGTIGFYPNSRTYVAGSLAMIYINSHDKPIDQIIDTKSSYKYVAPNLSFQFNYYISERLRLNANYSITYSNTKRDAAFDYLNSLELYHSSENVYQNVYINLSYAFF